MYSSRSASAREAATASGRSLKSAAIAPLGRFQVAFGVADQPPAGRRQRRLVIEAREDVVQRPLVWRGETYAVGDDERHAIRRGQIRQGLVVDRLVAIEMPLQFHVDVVAAEDPDQPIEQPAHPVLPRMQQLPPGKRHQAFHAAVERLERERAFSLRRVQLHRRDEP